MGIALVYEAFQHFIPTGEGWAKGFEDLNWSVYRLPSSNYRLCQVDEAVDVMVVHDLNPQTAEDLVAYKLAYPRTKAIVLCSTFEPLFPKLKGVVDLWCNLSIHNAYLQSRFQEHNMPFASISLASHESTSYPIQLAKIHDVSFIGTFGSRGHGYRGEDKYLFPVIDKGYHGYFGGGFSYKGVGYGPVSYPNLNTIYNSTKINLNFHYPFQKEESSNPESRLELNGRTFDVALSGNFQITDNPLTTQFFEDAIPVVTPEKWLETIDYYLKHEDERNRLAQKARTLARASHMYKHRVTEMLNQVHYGES